MQKTGRLLFLGTGGSVGVPMIGCTCSVCTSSSPFNKRLRPSALLELGKKRLLIDVGPDFRSQALRYGVTRLDGVLLTHSHFDHIAGIDDLRVFYFLQKKALPCLVSKETFQELKIRYHYLMRPLEKGKTICAQLDFQFLENDFGSIEFCSEHLEYVSYFQAGMKVTGYKIGDLAYISDIREYDTKVIDAISGVKTLILSALRYTSSDVHFNIDEAIDFARRVKAERTFLTHISHELDYELTNQKLPEDIRLSFDGLELEFCYE